jgi:hypothetical protein
MILRHVFERQELIASAPQGGCPGQQYAEIINYLPVILFFRPIQTHRKPAIPSNIPRGLL